MVEGNNEFYPDYFNEVEKEVYQYLDSNSPSSFLLFAGAGSGKTRTLVNVLKHVKKHDVKRFIDEGEKIAVITFTNAACDEIKLRLQYDPTFSVSTIHSFAWDLIKPFTEDIREFLRERLTEQISELQSKIVKARDPNGKTVLSNVRSRDSKQRRLEKIDSVVEFSYSPTSGGQEKDVLNHAEVISMASSFIANIPLMQTLLVKRFPILLIDESQDTDKNLMNALMMTQQNSQGKFVLGLFGDMMQRIYGGGKEDLDTNLPLDWKKPGKLVNYRCPRRVVALINDIRSDVDDLRQIPKEGAIEGVVRLFIVNSDVRDKSQVENSIREEMKTITNDKLWTDFSDVTCLTLEHAMAADRGDFAEFFTPLAKNSDLRDSVLDGTSQEIRFITDLVLPLVEAIKSDEQFEVARIVKQGSTTLTASNDDFKFNPIPCIENADSRVEELKPRLLNGDLNLKQVIKYFFEHGLLDVPERLMTYLEVDVSALNAEELGELSEVQTAWGKALLSKLSSVKNYADYIHEKSGFATHQGVKGLEFERVMAVLDDESAGGFLFKYEKLLGAEALSDKDKRNESEGKDSTPLRTRRLFYVICSRAEKSLAIVAYTKNPAAVRNYAIKSWFKEDEVIML